MPSLEVIASLSVAVINLPLGIGLGAWLVRSHSRTRAAALKKALAAPAPVMPATPNPLSPQAEQAILGAEKVEEVLLNFCQVTDDLKRDVGSHNEQMAGIEAALANIQANGTPESMLAVKRVVTSIVEANGWLKGQLATAQATIRDQAQELEKQVVEAQTDGLTGVPNRRAFDRELQRCFARWIRNGEEFSLLLLDIDRFKLLNDRYGHQAGDAVLRNTAKAVMLNVRDVDFAARYGGEEFAVLLPNTGLADAFTVAERVRTAVPDTHVFYEGNELSRTVSVGVASVLLGDDFESVVKRADGALYLSKRNGRNQTTTQDDLMSAAKPARPQVSETGLPMKSRKAGTVDVLERQCFCEQIRMRMEDFKPNDGPWTILLIDVQTPAAGGNEQTAAELRDLVTQLPSVFGRSIARPHHLGDYTPNRFGVLLTETPPDVGVQVAEGIRRVIEQWAQQCKTELSVSVGVVAPDKGEEWMSMLKRAEAIVGFARAAGGNCTYHQMHVTDAPSCATPQPAER